MPWNKPSDLSALPGYNSDIEDLAVIGKELELMPIPLLLVSKEMGVIVAANRAAANFYGAAKEDFSGLCFDDLFQVPGEGHELLLGGVQHIDLIYQHGKDGRRLPVSLDLRWQGILVYVFVLDREVIQRLDNRCLLAERNQAFLFQNSPTPMMMLDRQLNVVEVNRCARQLYGFGITQTLPIPLYDLLVNSSDLGQYRTRKGVVKLEAHWHRRLNGDPLLLEVMLSAFRRDRQLYFMAALTDMTEFDRRFSELCRAEQRWRFALEGYGDGVLEWLPKTGRVVFSKRLLEMLGLVPEEVREEFDYWDARIHPDDYQALHLILLRHLLGESEMIEADCRLLSADGCYRWYSLRARGVEWDAHGHANLVIGTLRDIHAVREQEMRERLHQEQLLHTARLATMGELVTLIAHEVAQPLTAINNYAAVARRNLSKGESGGDAEIALERISQLVQRTGDVVHRIRSFVRKGEIRLEDIAINGLIVEVIQLAGLQARAMSAEIELDLAIGLPEIRGDRMQISQLLLNLARNGLEAMTETDGPRRLRLRSRMNLNGFVDVEVEDSGCGLSTALTLDVITPFFTTKADGLGMGLSICRSVVDNHRGEFWASVAKPAGTIFHVRFPVRCDHA